MHAMTNPSDFSDSSSLSDQFSTSPVVIRTVLELLLINQDPPSFLLVSLVSLLKITPRINLNAHKALNL